MKYIKKFKTESDYTAFRKSESWITPHISLIETIKQVKTKPRTDTVKRVATFEVTQDTSNVLFANTSVISSIKVNGELDINFTPYKNVNINLTNNELYSHLSLGDDAFIELDDNTYYFNETYYNTLLNLPNINGFYNVTFKEEINPENIKVICLESVGSDFDIYEYDVNDVGLFTFDEERNSFYIPKDAIDMIEEEMSMYGFRLSFLFYDKTNPYNEYTIQTRGSMSPMNYTVDKPGTYEVEVEFLVKELPKDLFTHIYYIDHDSAYMPTSPLVGINGDFFKNCTSVPTFKGCTNLSTHVVIPSSVKNLPGIRLINMYGEIIYGESCGLFMGCINLPSYEFGRIFEIDSLQAPGLFQGCQSLTNIDLTTLRFKDLTSLSEIFSYCSNINSIDLSSVDTSDFTDMSYAFEGCSNLRLVIMMNDVSNMTDFYDSFGGVGDYGFLFYNPEYDYSEIINVLPETWTAIPFGAKNIGCGELSLSCSDTICPYFKTAEINYTATITGNSLTDNSVVSVDISGVGMSEFKETLSINGKDYSRMSFKFWDRIAFIDIEQNDDYYIYGKYKASEGSYSLIDSEYLYLDVIEEMYINNEPVTPTNTFSDADCEVIIKLKEDITNLNGLFYNCQNLTDVILGNFYGNITDISYMFYNCDNLKNIDVVDFDTSNVTNMESMFYGCKSLENIDVSNWDTSNVTTMMSMFYECTSLKNIDISNWDTGNLQYMSDMFKKCYSLEKLDLSGLELLDVALDGFIYMSGIKELIINTEVNTTVLSQSFYTLNDGGVFYYNPEYDYSVIQNDLKPNWISLPIMSNKQIVDLKIKENTTNVSGNATRAQVDYEITYLGVTGNSESSTTYTITGRTYSNEFEQNLSTTESREIDIEINVDGRVATGTIIQEPYECNLIYARYNNKVAKIFYFEAFDRISEMYINDTQVNVMPDVVFDNESYVVKLRINDNATSLGNLFRECGELEHADFSKVNTSSITDMNRLFGMCSGLTSVNLSNLDTSNVTDMSHMFNTCSNLSEIDVSNWDTSNATTMKSMFRHCDILTGVNVSNFDTSNVTDMSYMFEGCGSRYGYLRTVDVSNWDTSNVTDMSYMFNECIYLNNLDVSNWDTSNVTDMRSMFYNCRALNNMDVSNWDTSNVTDMSFVFYGCENLKTLGNLGVGNWDTSNVTTMRSMFYGCMRLENIDVSNFDTSNVTYMNHMFYACKKVPVFDVSNWDTSNVTDMRSMFYNCQTIETVDVSNWDTSNVTNMSYMFNYCSALKEIDISNFDTSNVTDMCYMFNYCSGLTSVNLSGLDTSNVTDMRYMFHYCFRLTGVDVSNFDTSNVTDMKYMFSDCRKLTVLDVSNFDTSNVTDMKYMFYNCKLLETIDVTNFDTSNVTDMKYMFEECAKVTSLDVSNWDTSNVTDMKCMFNNCDGLTRIDMSNCDTSDVDSVWYMFGNCDNLTEIKMGGKVNDIYEVYNMFGGINPNGTFYYNSAYDYSKVLAQLPSTWSRVPY